MDNITWTTEGWTPEEKRRLYHARKVYLEGISQGLSSEEAKNRAQKWYNSGDEWAPKKD